MRICDCEKMKLFLKNEEDILVELNTTVGKLAEGSLALDLCSHRVHQPIVPILLPFAPLY